MIKNPELFFNILSQNFDLGTHVGTYPCLYGDRRLRLNWDKDKEYIKVLSSVPAAIIKPSNHVVYREVRAIWLPNHDQIKPEILQVPGLSGLVAEINFDDLEVSAIGNSSKQYRMGVKVIKKPGLHTAEFSIEMPKEVFTPVIFESEGKTSFGFRAESNTLGYKGPKVSNADIRIAMTEAGQLFCVNSVDDVVQLRYFSQQIS